MNDAKNRALEALKNPQCSHLFANGAKGRRDPSSVLLGIVNGTISTNGYTDAYITFGSIAKSKIATTGSERNGSVHIIINDQMVGRNSWNMGNTDQNALTLLHELAHVYNIRQATLGGFAIGNFVENRFGQAYAFDKILDRQCFGGKLGYAWK